MKRRFNRDSTIALIYFYFLCVRVHVQELQVKMALSTFNSMFHFVLSLSLDFASFYVMSHVYIHNS